MGKGIFVFIDNFVENNLLKVLLESTFIDERVQILIDCLSAAIGIYIIYKGYMILAGRSQEPFKEILWDLIGKVFIIALLRNLDGLYDLAINFIHALQSWAMGDQDIKDLCDALTDRIGAYSAVLKKNTATFEPAFPYTIAANIFTFFATCYTFFTYIVTKITLAFLIVVAPIFIYCKLFGFLKETFSQWLKMVISNILTLLLISVCFRFGFDLINNVITDYTTSKSVAAAGTATGYLFCACFFQVAIVKIAVKIAEQTTSVSLEAAGMSSVSGIAGSAVGAVAGGIKHSVATAPITGGLGLAVKGLKAGGNAIKNKIGKGQ